MLAAGDMVSRYQAQCLIPAGAQIGDCDDFYIGKAKRRLHDRKTDYFKALILVQLDTT